MDEISRTKIIENRDFLCENTSLLRDIMRYLSRYDMFSDQEEFQILNGSTDTEEQLGDFYDLIVRKGKHAYGRLIEALKETKNGRVLQILEGNVPEPSKGSEGTITEKAFQKILRRSLVQCSNKTGNLLQLLQLLHSEEVISKHEMSVVRSKPTEFEQNNELFGNILPKKGPESFSSLLECLRESENDQIATLLLNLLKEFGP